MDLQMSTYTPSIKRYDPYVETLSRFFILCKSRTPTGTHVKVEQLTQIIFKSVAV